MVVHRGRVAPTRRWRVPLLAVAVLAPDIAAANWINDRFNNAIVNVDGITAQYRADVADQMRKVKSRTLRLPPPTAAEAGAMKRLDTWWWDRVAQPIGGTGKPLRMSLAYAYDSAMLYSTQIRAFGDLPAIRETLELEVQGRYALRGYVEGRMEDVNDPTRSLAVTGGSTRLQTRERVIEGGLRKRLITGADVAVGQRFANFRTNSTEWVPAEQARVRTFISVVQPLLRESGVEYVRSLHEVAFLDGEMGRNEFRRQVESHLLEVARAYWGLFQARTTYALRARVAESAGEIAGQLADRTGLDVDQLLLSRARSAQAQREADLLRSRAAVANAEVRLRALMNDPRLDQSVGEIVPVARPLMRYEPLPLQTVVERAVAFRPEVRQAFLQHRVAVLREGQAQVEGLPRLDVIGEANIGGRGLGQGQFRPAWDDSLGNADQPGYTLGMRLEVPLQADDAQARLTRRKLETRNARHQGLALLSTIVAEAELTLNEYEVAWREVGARALAANAARSDLGLETERWTQGVGSAAGETASNGLERLLAAQDRLIDAEERLSLAQTTLTVAFLALQRVQGTFTAVQRIGIARLDDMARGPAYVARRESALPPAPVVKP